MGDCNLTKKIGCKEEKREWTYFKGSGELNPKTKYFFMVWLNLSKITGISKFINGRLMNK